MYIRKLYVGPYEISVSISLPKFHIEHTYIFFLIIYARMRYESEFC